VWVPRTYEDLEAAIDVVAESGDLDFKESLGSNADLAKDIAGMTVHGGVIVYGVREEDTLAVELTPFPTAGIVEKIQQVADSRIRPSPPLEIDPIADPGDETRGFVVVEVGASPLAPHYAEERFPVRAGVTTRNLTEPEIADLYERRRAIRGSAVAAMAPLEGWQRPEDAFDADANPGSTGILRIYVTPLAFPSSVGARLRQPLADAVSRANETVAEIVDRGQMPVSVTADLADWSPRGTMGWAAGRASSDETVISQSRGPLAAAVYAYDGSFSFNVTRTLMVNREKCAFEHLFFLYAMECLSIAGHFYVGTAVGGILRCDLGISGWEGAASFEQTDGAVFVGNVRRVPVTSYSARGEFSAGTLAEDPAGPTRELFERLFVSFLPDTYDAVETLRSRRSDR
jgi:hypothetical protein